MAALTFDDVPEAGSAQPAPAQSGALTFDDVPETGSANEPWWQTAANKVGYAANRVASNLPFADRATAGLMAATGTGDYNTNLASVRAYNQELQKEHPYQELGATVAGGALLPAGAVANVARGAGVGAMAIRGATLGSGIGALQGASDVPDYTSIKPADIGNIGKQAGIGAALGGTLPIIGKGLGAAYRGAANAINGNVSGLSLPVQNVLTKAVTQDDPQRVLQKMQALGPQGMPLDAGPSLKGIASGIANSDSAGALAARGNLRNALETRNLGGDDRLAQALDQNLGPAQNPDAVNAAMDAQRDALGPGVSGSVKTAQGAGVQVDTTSVLANLGQKLADAQGNPKTVGVLGKVRGLLTDPVLDPQGNPIQGLLKPVTDPLRLHNAKSYLDDVINKGDLSLSISKGDISPSQGAIANLRGELNDAIRTSVPDYANVNDQLSSLHRQQDQLAAGKSDVLNGSPQTALHPESHAATFNPLPPVEQEAQRIGTRGLIDATTGVRGNDLSAVNNLLQGPNGWNTQKLATQFGQQPVQNVVGTAGAEQAMRGNYNTITQGTETANRLAMVKALKGEAPSQQPPVLPYFPPGGIARGLGNIPSWVGNKVIDAFRNTPNDSQFYNQLGNAVTTQGQQGDALVQALMRAGGNRAQNASTGTRIQNATMLGGALTPNALRAYRRQNQ